MNFNQNIPSEPVGNQIEKLEQEHTLINDERKEELQSLAKVISTQLKEQGASNLIFICTHNSRRSQLAEIWLRAAVSFYGISGIMTYSGGTEATAFNHRMVAALERAGFDILVKEGVGNPTYTFQMDPTSKMFSKKFDDSFNPPKDYIAVMVCSQADEECPFVPGAFSRIALPYEDPKYADDKPQEQEVYDLKVREIGREMIYLAKVLKETL